MLDGKAGDANFIRMMHDFVTTNSGKSRVHRGLSTHRRKTHAAGSRSGPQPAHGLFFKEWVYGKEAPSYHLDYTLQDTNGGHVLLAMRISQQDVSPSFKMRMPVYLD